MNLYIEKVDKKELIKLLKKRHFGQLVFYVDFRNGVEYEYYQYLQDFYLVIVVNEQFQDIHKITDEEFVNSILNYWRQKGIYSCFCAKC